jgi:hypothetical protein
MKYEIIWKTLKKQWGLVPVMQPNGSMGYMSGEVPSSIHSRQQFFDTFVDAWKFMQQCTADDNCIWASYVGTYFMVESIWLQSSGQISSEQEAVETAEEADAVIESYMGKCIHVSRTMITEL